MYAVTGATGQLGQHVIAKLSKLTSPSNIVAAVRTGLASMQAAGQDLATQATGASVTAPATV